MRTGAEYFLHPAGSSQRRYEALRAYFTQDMPAAEVADRFGYSTASVHQMATLLRTGRLNLFTDPRPGPKGPRKATGERRARVLALRAAGQRHRDRRRADRRRAADLGADHLADPGRRGDRPAAAPRRGPPRPASPPGRWSRQPSCPAGRTAWCRLPVTTPGCCCCSRRWAELGLPRLVRAALGHPSTRQLSCSRSGRCCWPSALARPGIHHAGECRRRCEPGVHPRADRAAQGHPIRHLLLAVAASPTSNCCPACRRAATARAGHRRGRVRAADFHAIRHHGGQAVLEKHYVPRRSQRTRAVLTFFAQDHASAEMG